MTTVLYFAAQMLALVGCQAPGWVDRHLPVTPAPPSAPALGPLPINGRAPFYAPPIMVMIPVELAGAAHAETIAAVAPSEVSAGVPSHLRVTFGGGPEIRVFPATEYAALNVGADYSIGALKEILANATLPSADSRLPILPSAFGGRVFAAKMKILPFEGGSGLRMITQYSSDVSPISNGRLLYQFTGLSADGKYFISLQESPRLPFLPAAESAYSAVPPGGLEFPTDGIAIEHYFAQIVALIENAPESQFNPPLDTLDMLVESIAIL